MEGKDINTGLWICVITIFEAYYTMYIKQNLMIFIGRVTMYVGGNIFKEKFNR